MHRAIGTAIKTITDSMTSALQIQLNQPTPPTNPTSRHPAAGPSDAHAAVNSISLPTFNFIPRPAVPQASSSNTCNGPPTDQGAVPMNEPPARLLNEAIPLAGVNIPDLGHDPKLSWKRAIKQWEEMDPSTGYALKDWPKSWYTGSMRRKMATKRTGRGAIAQEYNRLGRDDAVFLDEYPEASKGYDTLLEAIRARKGTQRRSKNGTPEERARCPRRKRS